MLKPGDPGYKIPEVPASLKDIEHLKRIGSSYSEGTCGPKCRAW